MTDREQSSSNGAGGAKCKQTAVPGRNSLVQNWQRLEKRLRVVWHISMACPLHWPATTTQPHKSHSFAPSWLQNRNWYLCAVECYSCKDSLRHTGSLQLISDLLVNIWRDFHRWIWWFWLDSSRDRWMIQELLVDSLWVLVSQESADSNLLVYQMGHGYLLPHQLWTELRRQEPRVDHGLHRWHLVSDWSTVVNLAMRRLFIRFSQSCQLVDIW